MKVLVTGANGFLGKNLTATLSTMPDIEVLKFDINNTKEELKEYAAKAEFVVHLAGINRPTDPKEFYEGNAGFTETLCSYLEASNNKAPIIISSSIQAAKDNDYGKSKKEGEELLLKHAKENNSEVYIYRFANLFGKWCRPNYNSVTATWCYNIANDLEISVSNPEAELILCYVDDVVKEILNCISGKPTMVNNECKVLPEYKITLDELSKTIYSFKESRKDLEVVNMGNPLISKLYSTYLSYLPKDKFSYPLKMNVDNRGSFTEILKTNEHGQVSVNISKPGITKGNHWHHSKNEKFLVVSGKGLIQFRDIYSDEVIDYYVSEEKLEVIDIPTGYTHNIINVGDKDMVTIMWANEKFDPNNPDTYFEEV
ncbi:MAG: NAD-dependent epimerase/dehydratase family protein [Erysipelotrichaceae bacterium]